MGQLFLLSVDRNGEPKTPQQGKFYIPPLSGSIVVMLAGFFALVHFQFAAAETRDVSHVRVGKNVLAPLAFVDFCRRNPARCNSNERSHRIELDDVRSKQLNLVNRMVNHSVAPLPDPWGTNLPWQDDASVGRCVDYALTKRSLLMDLGWPADALLLAVVALPSGEAHAVLLVKTNREDIVLDNLVDGINRWDALPYSWQSMMSSTNPLYWQKITPIFSSYDAHHQSTSVHRMLRSTTVIAATNRQQPPRPDVTEDRNQSSPFAVSRGQVVARYKNDGL
jgi:predicted transglutaminase-like cysteine proteinase